MAGRVHLPADVGDRMGQAGRGLVVDDHDPFDLVRLVLTEALLQGTRRHAVAPVGRK